MTNRQVFQVPQEITPWDLKAFLTTPLACAPPVIARERAALFCLSPEDAAAWLLVQSLFSRDSQLLKYPALGTISQVIFLPRCCIKYFELFLLFYFKYSAEKKGHISFCQERGRAENTCPAVAGRRRGFFP